MEILSIILLLALVGAAFYFFMYGGMMSSTGGGITSISMPTTTSKEGYSTGKEEAVKLKQGGGSTGVSPKTLEEMQPVKKNTSTNSPENLFDDDGGTFGGGYMASNVTFFPTNF